MEYYIEIKQSILLASRHTDIQIVLFLTHLFLNTVLTARHNAFAEKSKMPPLKLVHKWE